MNNIRGFPILNDLQLARHVTKISNGCKKEMNYLQNRVFETNRVKDFISILQKHKTTFIQRPSLKFDSIRLFNLHGSSLRIRWNSNICNNTNNLSHFRFIFLTLGSFEYCRRVYTHFNFCFRWCQSWSFLRINRWKSSYTTWLALSIKHMQ